jgi:hypothetical protein
MCIFLPGGVVISSLADAILGMAEGQVLKQKWIHHYLL